MASGDQELRRELGVEREKLAEAVTTLRTEVARAKDVRNRVKAKLPVAAAGALGLAFVAAGGVRRTVRLVRRR